MTATATELPGPELPSTRQLIAVGVLVERAKEIRASIVPAIENGAEYECDVMHDQADALERAAAILIGEEQL